MADQGTAVHDPEKAGSPRLTLPLVLLGGVGVLLIAATLGLWAHYGTAVFYEMIVAGIAACF
jgi:hypothetical protein